MEMWNYYEVSRKGYKEHHEVCQDYHLHLEKNGVICMVLCDGASSADHAEIGARCIAKFAADFIADHFDVLWNGDLNTRNNCIVQMHQRGILRLSAQVEELGYAPIYNGKSFLKSEILHYSTTLQVIAVRGRDALLYKVGNGTALCLDQGTARLLSASVKEEFTPHFTYADSLSTLLRSELKTYRLSDTFQGFVLMTDGVEGKKGLADQNGLRPALIPFLQKFLEQPEEKRLSFLDEQADAMARESELEDDLSVSVMLCTEDVQIGSESNEIPQTPEMPAGLGMQAPPEDRNAAVTEDPVLQGECAVAHSEDRNVKLTLYILAALNLLLILVAVLNIWLFPALRTENSAPSAAGTEMAVEAPKVTTETPEVTIEAAGTTTAATTRASETSVSETSTMKTTTETTAASYTTTVTETRP